MSKQLLKSKRGMAMESAILFMLIIFSLCALLSAATLTGHYQNKLEQKLLENKTEIDQFGEWFLAGALEFDENGKGNSNGYDSNGYDYYRKETESKETESDESSKTTVSDNSTKTYIVDFYLTAEGSNTVLLHIMTQETVTTVTTVQTTETTEPGETTETDESSTTSKKITLLCWTYSGTFTPTDVNSQS